MSDLIASYFSKSAYLPIRPIVKQKLQAILDSAAPNENRRTAFEEAVHALPIFAYNLLKLVNSSVFNLKTKVVVLKQASTLPTFELYADLVKSMPEYPAEFEETFSLARFEEHSRATALAVQILVSLSKRFSTQDRERLYTAAILHDIGRVFLTMSDPTGYARLWKENDPQASVIDLEKKYFGTDHATLSVLAVEAIGIADAEVKSAIQNHHGVPTGSGVLVAYADRIVKRFGVGPSSGVTMSVGETVMDESRLKVAVEEVVHLTVGEALMAVVSEIDTLMTTGTIQFKNVAGAID